MVVIQFTRMFSGVLLTVRLRSLTCEVRSFRYSPQLFPDNYQSLWFHRSVYSICPTFSYQNKSGIHDIAGKCWKWRWMPITVTKFSRPWVLCVWYFFFFLKWTETPVKQGKNTWQIGNYILFVFKTKFRYKHRIRIRTKIMQTKWIDDSRTQTPAKTGMWKMY